MFQIINTETSEITTIKEITEDLFLEADKGNIEILYVCLHPVSYYEGKWSRLTNLSEEI